MPNALRTATPMADWRSFRFTCDESGGMCGIKEAKDSDVLGARTSYLYQIQDAVGAILESVDFGDEGVIFYEAEKILVPKMTESTDIFLPGDRVYWDPVTRLVTPTYNSAYFWIGMCTEPADADEMYVEIDLSGHHAEVEAALP